MGTQASRDFSTLRNIFLLRYSHVATQTQTHVRGMLLLSCCAQGATTVVNVAQASRGFEIGCSALDNASCVPYDRRMEAASATVGHCECETCNANSIGRCASQREGTYNTVG